MAKTEITKQELQALLSYDPNTGLFRWLNPQSPRMRPGDLAGNLRPDGYRQIRLKGGRYLAHRLAWLYMTETWPKIVIDHINHDQTDNRWCNLREATISQNCAHGKIRSHNTSGFKGVTWNLQLKKWRAAIRANGHTRHLGCFNTREEAHATYCIEATKAFGDFALLKWRFA